jgi:hypothetical protein
MPLLAMSWEAHGKIARPLLDLAGDLDLRWLARCDARMM